MDYSEKEIRQANCAFGMMKEQDKLTSGYDVRSAMGRYGDPYNMVTVLRDDLKLIASKGDSWVLTDEGRKAQGWDSQTIFATGRFWKRFLSGGRWSR